MDASRLNCWKTKPMRRLRTSARAVSLMWLTSSPARWYRPAVGTSRQPKMCMSVDLPEPEGPMMATYSPCSIVRLTPRSAATEIDPVRYTLVTRSRSMTASSAVTADVPRGGVITLTRRRPGSRRWGSRRPRWGSRRHRTPPGRRPWRPCRRGGPGPAARGLEGDLALEHLGAGTHAARDLGLTVLGGADGHVLDHVGSVHTSVTVAWPLESYEWRWSAPRSRC